MTVARSAGDRALLVMLAGLVVVGLAAGFPRVSARDAVTLDGYAEWRRAGSLIVDGQRVQTDDRTRWKGAASTFTTIALGDEVRVLGVRDPDGAVLALEVDVRPNGNALFEDHVRQETNSLEGEWLNGGEAFERDGRGGHAKLGAIESDGPRVERVRQLVGRLTPPYLASSNLRTYVIANKEWNALAMGNGSLWIFSGLLDDMTDAELAIVVGHELAHYTHEHSRRQMRKNVWGQVGRLAAMLAAAAIDSSSIRIAAEAGASLGLTAWGNGYSRDLEDQADRVGLRYAYEAGFDVAQAPRVWQRFLDRYGENDRLTNFFFADHSRASDRRRTLAVELAQNYER
ncbi:MAG: M48 family metalloprotease [Acidobacteriota bacterium]